MNAVIQFLSCRFYSQQVTMSTAFEPLAVGFFGLLATRKCDTNFAVCLLVGLLDNAVYFIRKSLSGKLTGLNGYRPIAVFVGKSNSLKHFIFRKGITVSV